MLLVPGGANCVAAELDSPKMCVYAGIFGFRCDDHIWLRMMLDCRSNISHSKRRQLGYILASPALK